MSAGPARPWHVREAHRPALGALAFLALAVAGCAPHGVQCNELGVVVCETGRPVCPEGRTPSCDVDFLPICLREAFPDDGIRPRCE